MLQNKISKRIISKYQTKTGAAIKIPHFLYQVVLNPNELIVFLKGIQQLADCDITLVSNVPHSVTIAIDHRIYTISDF